MNYKDGLIQCERCGKGYNILYPLRLLKAYVGCNGENDIDYQEHYKMHHICENCYDDFLVFLDDKKVNFKLEEPEYQACCHCAGFCGAYDHLTPKEVDGKDASYGQSLRGVCTKPDCVDVSENPEEVYAMFTDYDEEACECFIKSKENHWSEEE